MNGFDYISEDAKDAVASMLVTAAAVDQENKREDAERVELSDEGLIASMMWLASVGQAEDDPEDPEAGSVLAVSLFAVLLVQARERGIFPSVEEVARMMEAAS